MSISRRQRENKALRILRQRRDAAARRGDIKTKNRLIETLEKMLVIRSHSAVQAEVPGSEKSLNAGPTKVSKI